MAQKGSRQLVEECPHCGQALRQEYYKVPAGGGYEHVMGLKYCVTPECPGPGAKSP